MSTPSAAGVPPQPGSDDELYQKVGRCVIQLQQFELALKAVSSVRPIHYSAPDVLNDALIQRAAKVAKQTLGVVVGEVFAEQVVTVDTEGLIDLPEASGAMAAIGLVIGVDAQGRELVEARVKGLVERRNLLVHRFLLEFDLRTSEGRAAADQFLDALITDTDEFVRILREWLEALVAMREVATKVR
jgi:hypothetical protein